MSMPGPHLVYLEKFNSNGRMSRLATPSSFLIVFKPWRSLEYAGCRGLPFYLGVLILGRNPQSLVLDSCCLMQDVKACLPFSLYYLLFLCRNGGKEVMQDVEACTSMDLVFQDVTVHLDVIFQDVKVHPDVLLQDVTVHLCVQQHLRFIIICDVTVHHDLDFTFLYFV
jgi:hypothetical protein